MFFWQPNTLDTVPTGLGLRNVHSPGHPFPSGRLQRYTLVQSCTGLTQCRHHLPVRFAEVTAPLRCWRSLGKLWALCGHVAGEAARLPHCMRLRKRAGDQPCIQNTTWRLPHLESSPSTAWLIPLTWTCVDLPRSECPMVGNCSDPTCRC